MSDLTKDHFDIMRHSLGLTRSKESYRNYFCADEGHSDLPLIRDLIAAGYMEPAKHRTSLAAGDRVYVVTDAGHAALASQPL